MPSSECAGRPPAVSVIIATYNWSAVLRYAIRSVLLQTIQDFEILVVGDGCTDDSEAVVATFDDPRIRWHNLATNTGSQWAPNNFGLRHAAADWVAYLGHDDIWYPTHLEAILRTARRTEADVVTSVMVLYGPPGSGMRGLAGIFPDGMCTDRDFVPPTAMAHRRSVTESIGFWKDAEASAFPVDIEFWRAAVTSKLSFASTNELTTFKFNAAWRRDTYKSRPTIEQDDLLRRIETGIDFRHVELVGVLHARAVDKLIDIKMTDTSEHAAGAIHHANRRFKGVERRFAADELRRLDAAERFYLTAADPGFEWHLSETDERFGSFRWSGPAVRSAIDLPVRVEADLSVRMHVIHQIQSGVLEHLKLFANSRPVECRLEQTSLGTVVVHGLARFDPSDTPDDGLRVTFELDTVLRPVDLGVNEDRRWLGIAVNWVEVEPILSNRQGSSAREARDGGGAA